MKLNLTYKQGKLDKALTAISFVLFGVFLTSIVFAVPINFFEVKGVYLGLVLNAALIFCGLYFFPKGHKTRKITWSMLATLLILIIGYFSLLSILSLTFNEL